MWDRDLVNLESKVLSLMQRLKCCLRGGGVETTRDSLSHQGCPVAGRVRRGGVEMQFHNV